MLAAISLTANSVHADRSRPQNGEMPTTGQWLAFVVASALFIQLPGPSLLFTIGRALTVGRRDALLSVVGNALGILTQVLAIAVGLGAVVATSAQAYTILKLAGAAYVVWLGIQAIRHRADARAALGSVVGAPLVRARALHSLRVGFTVGVTNPKTIVFFVAFLPQFVNEPAGHAGLQLTALGLLFGAMCVASDSIWALAASKARDWFARRPQRLDRLGVAGGVMMIGLGATMAATE
jgi:threonine/homoserine/homoserine lactone efflux protein